MHLSLKTILAYIDNLFDPEYQRVVKCRIAEQPDAVRLLERIENVTRNPTLSVPGRINDQIELPASVVATYLDHQLSDHELTQFEKYCLSSDVFLAETACAHQILTTVLGDPAPINRECRLKIYAIPKKLQEKQQQQSQSTTLNGSTDSTTTQQTTTGVFAETPIELPADLLPKRKRITIEVGQTTSTAPSKTTPHSSNAHFESTSNAENDPDFKMMSMPHKENTEQSQSTQITQTTTVAMKKHVEECQTTSHINVEADTIKQRKTFEGVDQAGTCCFVDSEEGNVEFHAIETKNRIREAIADWRKRRNILLLSSVLLMFFAIFWLTQGFWQSKHHPTKQQSAHNASHSTVNDFVNDHDDSNEDRFANNHAIFAHKDSTSDSTSVSPLAEATISAYALVSPPFQESNPQMPMTAETSLSNRLTVRPSPQVAQHEVAVTSQASISQRGQEPLAYATESPLSNYISDTANTIKATNVASRSNNTTRSTVNQQVNEQSRVTSTVTQNTVSRNTPFDQTQLPTANPLLGSPTSRTELSITPIGNQPYSVAQNPFSAKPGDIQPVYNNTIANTNAISIQNTGQNDNESRSTLQIIDLGNAQSASQAVQHQLPAVRPLTITGENQPERPQTYDAQQSNQSQYQPNQIPLPQSDDDPMAIMQVNFVEGADDQIFEPYWNENTGLFEQVNPSTGQTRPLIQQQSQSPSVILQKTNNTSVPKTTVTAAQQMVRHANIASSSKITSAPLPGVLQRSPGTLVDSPIQQDGRASMPDFTASEGQVTGTLILANDDLALLKSSPNSDWVWLPVSKQLTNDIVLVPAPFLATVQLPNGIMIETEGDTRFRLLPPDQNGVPGIAFDCGHLTVYAAATPNAIRQTGLHIEQHMQHEQNEIDQPLGTPVQVRVITPLGGGVLTLEDTQSYACVDSENKTVSKLLRTTQQYQSVTANPDFYAASVQSSSLYCPNMMIYPAKNHEVIWHKDGSATPWPIRVVAIFPLDMQKSLQPTLYSDALNIRVVPVVTWPSLVSYDGNIPISKLDLKNQFVTMPNTFFPTPSKIWLLK